ncbi:MAG: glycoside hydrolase family 32 protein [Candidatus Nanopelagicales bacterium]
MRKRPRFHFTPKQGWMNDPHGILWDGSRYHMFFQYVPDSLVWQSNIEWGHAISEDLIHWTQIESLLIPENEVGCWSGSVVEIDDSYLLFYTLPSEEDLSRGQVVVAKANRDFSECKRIEPPVIESAPSEEFIDFRDPQVRRVDGGFLMTIGAGIKDFGGCSLQYTSQDAYKWEFDRVLASRSANEHNPIATGTIWECPQFVDLESKSCLLFSSINPDSYQQVQYAFGTSNQDGFQPEMWGNLGFSEIPYATSTFHDKDDNACFISWLKESSDVNEYSGAQSVPLMMKESGNRLRVEIHPNLNRYFQETAESTIQGNAWLSLSGGSGEMSVRLIAKSNELDISIERDTVEIRVNEVKRMYEISAGVKEAEILIDADILEIILPDTPMALSLRIPREDVWEIANTEGTLIKRNYWGE